MVSYADISMRIVRASAANVILPSLNPIAAFSIDSPVPRCAVAFKISTDFDCFGAGAGLNFLSERLDLNVESSDRFTYAENRALLYNGSFGILWQINNFELAASLLQIGARDRWSVSTSISAQERETQDITVDVPLKGLVGARRYISDSLFVVSLQIDVEKVLLS